jgi:hypothetical protein
LGVSALFTSANAAECHAKPNPNATSNTNPIITTAPQFVKQIKNAKLFSVGGAPGTSNAVNLVHLYGTPYEMGYAHASIANESVSALLNGVYTYLEEQVEQALNGTKVGGHNLKPFFVDLVASLGLAAALAAEVAATAPWTGQYFNEELQGMADATGIPFEKIQHIHMIGELTKGSCSLYGAWGNATESGTLHQLRALDWDVDGPFKNHPEIVVYHPTVGANNGHAFANVAWAGFIGSITGMSSNKMAISEIGVSFPDATFGKESRFGVPFTYLLRDILQFDSDLAATELHLKSASRTCDLIFGVGDGKTNEFRSVQYSASVANFYTDMDMEPVEDWHPRMKDIVYYGMDWLCPTYTTVFHEQLTKVYGKISAATTITDIVPIVQTGDLHIALYDLAYGKMHVSVARRDGQDGPQMAYDRAFIELDMDHIFDEPAPSV